MTSKRKILAFALALSLVLSFAVSAMAAEAPNGVPLGTSILVIEGEEYEVDFVTGGTTATAIANGITVTAKIEGVGTWVSLGTGEGIKFSFTFSGTAVESGTINLSLYKLTNGRKTSSSLAAVIAVYAGEDVSKYSYITYTKTVINESERISMGFDVNFYEDYQYNLKAPVEQTLNGVTFGGVYQNRCFVAGEAANFSLYWLGKAVDSGSYTLTLSSQKANYSDSITIPVGAGYRYYPGSFPADQITALGAIQGGFSFFGLNDFIMPAMTVDDVVLDVSFTPGEFIPLVMSEIKVRPEKPNGPDLNPNMYENGEPLYYDEFYYYRYNGYKFGNEFFLSNEYAEPKEEGYTFLGYYDEAGNLLTQDTITTGSITYKGRWQANNQNTTNNDSTTTTTSSSDSNSGTSSGGNTTPTPPNAPQDVTTAAANKAVDSAIAAAKAGDSDTAKVRIKNPGDISLSTLQSMATRAGMPITFQADSMSANNRSVDVRIAFDPALATQNLNLSASTINAQASKTTTLFTNHFSNNLMTVSLGQQGSFGMTVEIAAKLSLNLDTKNLVFYAYDRATNTYRQITSAEYWIDKNGYVHFSTQLAGDIIISDKPLARK